MNLNTKTKYINAIITHQNIDKIFIKDLEKYLSNNSVVYSFILHDKDVDDLGEKKTKHVHIVYEKSERLRLSTELNNLCKHLSIKAQLISIEKCTNYVGSMQYLIHKNNASKYQYDANEIITNMDLDELSNTLNMVNQVISFEYLIEVITYCNSIVEVIQVLGLNNYRFYRTIIIDIMKGLQKQIIGIN